METQRADLCLDVHCRWSSIDGMWCEQIDLRLHPPEPVDRNKRT